MMAIKKQVNVVDSIQCSPTWAGLRRQRPPRPPLPPDMITSGLAPRNGIRGASLSNEGSLCPCTKAQLRNLKVRER